MIFLSMSSTNIAKISIWIFFFHFTSAWKETTSMFWIKNDSFWMIETECLRIFEALLWVAEEMKVDRDQLKCFVFDEIEKIEIEIFNWLENTIVSCLMFNNISFLFIQSLLNMTLWCSISAISIDTVNFLWLSIVRLSRILWVIVFLANFSSYSCINFSFASNINCISSFWHTLLTSLSCISV